MVERRMGIWAAILLLVIASRGCSGDDPTSDAAEEDLLLEIAKLVVSDPREAVKTHWSISSWSAYSISMGTFGIARWDKSREDFQADLSDLNSVVLKDKMKKAKTNVLFSSDECLLVEAATQDSHTTPFNFLYQLILVTYSGLLEVDQAFILGGYKRPISQHGDILDKLTSTIENSRGLSDILTDDGPLLALQVLDGESCEPHSGRTRARVDAIYRDKFLSLFGESDRLRVTAKFEGDKHFQFTGDIWSTTSGDPIYTFFMAATVVGKGFDKRVQSIHIIVKKKVATDPLRKLVELVVSDLVRAFKRYWHEESLSYYNISLGGWKMARPAGQLASRVDLSLIFEDLSKLDNGVLMDKMVNAKTKILFSSNKCLLVEAATEDSQIGEPPYYFLYQLVLDGDVKSPKVKQAFFLARQKRPEILQHTNIRNQLRSTIENPEGVKLSDILTDDDPLLAMQVLEGKSCETYEGRSKTGATNTYERKFLSLFGEFYELDVALPFEGDEYIQFTGDIWSTSGDPICFFLMAATVVGEGFDKRVQSIHIIVQKDVDVAEDSGYDSGSAEGWSQ